MFKIVVEENPGLGVVDVVKDAVVVIIHHGGVDVDVHGGIVDDQGGTVVGPLVVVTHTGPAVVVTDEGAGVVVGVDVEAGLVNITNSLKIR